MEENSLAAVGQEILCACRNELYLNMPYLDEAFFALAPMPGDEVTVSAATDGMGFYYNGSYLANSYLRSGKIVNRLYLHSILHCMFRHLAKRRGRDSALWDLACDAAAESIIDSLPYPCLNRVDTPIRQRFYGECRRELKVLTAEGIYRMLLRQRRPEYEIAQLQRAFLLDDHGLWDLEKDGDDKSGKQDKQWQNIASKTQTAMETVLSKEAQGGEAVLEQVRVAARDDVDYRKFLRRFAAPREVMKSDGDAFDYIYYTYGLSRYGNMPLIEPPETREEKRIEDFVIAIDTSMSTSGALVREFLSSTYTILRSTDTFTRKLNIHILQCDDQLRSDTLITNLEELRRFMDDLPLMGGSATDFRPVFEYVDGLIAAGSFTNLRGLIYFTDGMGIYPTRRPNYEVAFVLLEEPPLEVKMPAWAIRITLDLPDYIPTTQVDESVWIEEILEELPQL